MNTTPVILVPYEAVRVLMGGNETGSTPALSFQKSIPRRFTGALGPWGRWECGWVDTAAYHAVWSPSNSWWHLYVEFSYSGCEKLEKLTYTRTIGVADSRADVRRLIDAERTKCFGR